MRLIWLFLVCFAGSACADEDLAQKIHDIAAEAHGKVSVACSLPGSSLTGDLFPHAHPPMQSVFKLPVALAVLHQVEQGKFSLHQEVYFGPDDRFVPHAYSPLQDKFPQGGVNVPLEELLQRSVSESDNVAADILLRLAGGPKAVSDYVASLGVVGFHFLDGEHAMHRNSALQYRNWFEPEGAVQLLRRIGDHSPLTPPDTKLLVGWMEASNITTRLAADLPKGTHVAHKSGSSGEENGLAAATNDIGLITLPDGRQLAIAVFVTDSTADAAMRDQIIGRIGRAAYDAAVGMNPSR